MGIPVDLDLPWLNQPVQQPALAMPGLAFGLGRAELAPAPNGRPYHELEGAVSTMTTMSESSQTQVV